MLRKYEACFLISPELSQEALDAETAGLSGIISAAGAKIVHQELWGRRGLMYPINKKTEGFYYIFYFESESGNAKKITDSLKLRENIMRSLFVTRKNFPPQPEKTDGEPKPE